MLLVDLAFETTFAAQKDFLLTNFDFDRRAVFAKFLTGNWTNLLNGRSQLISFGEFLCTGELTRCGNHRSDQKHSYFLHVLIPFVE